MFDKLGIVRLPTILLALVVIGTILLACSTSPSRAQMQAENVKESGGVDKDVQGVDEFIDTFQECYSSRDIDGLRDLFMDGGAVIVDFEGKVRQYTTKEWLRMTENIFNNNSHLSDRLTEREIDIYRNIAVVRCRYDFEGPIEQSTGHDIFSLVRHSDSWLIVSLMYSGNQK